MSTRRILPFAPTTAARRWWLGLCLGALLFAQALGLAHRVAHGSASAVAQIATTDGHDDAFGHGATQDCRLFDQAGLADLALVTACAAIGVRTAQAPSAQLALAWRSAAAVTQRARGPPARA